MKVFTKKLPDTYKKQYWITEEEGAWLNRLVRLYTPSIIFESGTNNGYSTTWLSAGNPSAVVHTYDPINRGEKVWKYADVPIGTIYYHRKPFKDSRKVIATRPEGRKSLFFIDGEHTTSGIREDWGALSGNLRNGDVIVFHDIFDAPVNRHVSRLVTPQPENEDPAITFHRMGIEPELANSEVYRIRTKRGMEVVVYAE